MFSSQHAYLKTYFQSYFIAVMVTDDFFIPKQKDLSKHVSADRHCTRVSAEAEPVHHIFCFIFHVYAATHSPSLARTHSLLTPPWLPSNFLSLSHLLFPIPTVSAVTLYAQNAPSICITQAINYAQGVFSISQLRQRMTFFEQRRVPTNDFVG